MMNILLCHHLIIHPNLRLHIERPTLTQTSNSQLISDLDFAFWRHRQSSVKEGET